MQSFDVVVIGAGVAGCCVARELSRLDAGVCVLEAGLDVGNGATRANSGIVHAGYDPKPGTLKAKYNVAGNAAFDRWCQDLEFPFYRNGSLVCAFSEEELEAVRGLVARAAENGVPAQLLDAAAVREMEPNVNPEVLGALFAPTGGICDPMALSLAALENAVENGATALFEKRVSAVERDGEAWLVRCDDGSAYAARAVVNCAGVYADEINNQVSARKLHITPTRGDYVLYDTPYAALFERTMFQTPSSKGKGVLVAHTIHGNLFVGPNAEAQESKERVATTREGLDGIIAGARRTWPGASMRGAITNFAGLRAKGDTGDFVIGPVEDAPGFFNVACFESPGLTSAPAVAEDMRAWVQEYLGCAQRADFNPRRPFQTLFAMMDDEQRAAAIAQDPAWGRVVCRCCNVTEAEIVRALHGPVPVLCLDALKWRTGAMMGRCHSGFCAPEVIRIVSRELGIPPEQVRKRFAGGNVASASRPDFVELACAEQEQRAQAGEAAQQAEAPALEGVYDIVIVGAGAAGLAAALAAAKAGAHRLAVMDRAAAFGGIMNQCIHNGFGLHRYKEELTGPEYAARQLADLREMQEQGLDLTFLMETTALRVSPQPDGSFIVGAVNGTGLGAVNVAARAVVLATGSRERGAGEIGFPGDRPAGVYTAGSAQAMTNLQGFLPGKRAVIYGSGDIGLIMARRMAISGMEVLGVYARGPKASGLHRNVVQCLDDYGIPLHLCRHLERVEGDARVTACWFCETDPETKQPIPGTEFRVECDTLVLSCGLVPENELAKTAGVAIDARSQGVLADKRTCASTVAGIFAAGNNVQICGLADDASKQADKAGASAAKYALAQAQGGAAAAIAAVAPFVPEEAE